MKKKIIISAAAILILIQFFRINKENPVVNSSNDFLIINKAPDSIAQTIRSSCYDCHSNETQYPWYSNIAPVSWVIKHHINEGREKMNFSDWGQYSSKKRQRKVDGAIEMIEGNDMPLKSYTLIHRDAILNPAKKDSLIIWLKSLNP